MTYSFEGNWVTPAGRGALSMPDAQQMFSLGTCACGL